MRPTLTPRESEVAGSVARGLRSKQIARLLGIAPKTADFHVGHVLQKLNCRNRRELARRVVVLPMPRRAVATIYNNSELADAAE